MRRILVSEFVTLDGVIEAPGHEEHRDGRNAWALSLTSEDMLAHAAQQLLEVDALLLGRVTFNTGPRSGHSRPTSSSVNGSTPFPSTSCRTP